jgi:hypothetical protein
VGLAVHEPTRQNSPNWITINCSRSRKLHRTIFHAVWFDMFCDSLRTPKCHSEGAIFSERKKATEESRLCFYSAMFRSAIQGRKRPLATSQRKELLTLRLCVRLFRRAVIAGRHWLEDMGVRTCLVSEFVVIDVLNSCRHGFSNPSIFVTVHGYTECHSEGACFPKENSDRRIWPLCLGSHSDTGISTRQRRDSSGA